MSNLIQAKKDAVIDLDKICGIYHDATGFNSGSGQTKSVTISMSNGYSVNVLETDEQYSWWLKYMAQQNTLAVRMLQDIQCDAFDPFLDEMPRTLFAVFASIPWSHEMVLSLLQSGEGGVWMADEKDQRIENALVRWHSFDDALDKLQTFKSSRQ